MKKFKSIIIITFVAIFFTTLSYSQETEEKTAESEEAALAKATQNPLAAMYSLPFQNNTTFGVGEYNRAQNVLNIQPVIPIGLGKKINLINRIIIPVVTQPSSVEDKSSTGVADIVYTAWLSPTKVSKITWGVGPVFQIPTGSEADQFGSREFGIGPSIVALTTLNHWVVGFVTNYIWTFGDAAEDKFLFQYFANYNLPKAVYLVTAPILTANWNASSGDKWIVPFGAGIGKVFKIGKQPININAQGYYNVVKPDYWGAWQMRLQVQLLFPKKKK